MYSYFSLFQNRFFVGGNIFFFKYIVSESINPHEGYKKSAVTRKTRTS